MIFKILFCLGTACIIFLPILAVWAWTGMKIAKYESITEPYFMGLSPFYFIVGIIGSIFFYGLTVMMVFISEWDSGTLAGVLLFMAFTFFCGYLCFVSLLWEIKVDTDTLTIYRFPLRPKVIYFSEITKVRYIEKIIRNNGAGGRRQLIAYHDKKKLFEVDDDMSHFALLYRRLEAEKGLERGYLKEGGVELNAYQDNFSVAETRADKIRALFGALLGIGLLGGGIFCWGERKELPYYPLYYAGFFLFFVIGTWNFLDVMMRKVTVKYQDIYVRNIRSVMGSLFTRGASDKERCYSLRKITRVEDKEDFIVLYVDKQKIAKIWKSDKNFALLAERIERAKKEK